VIYRLVAFGEFLNSEETLATNILPGRLDFEFPGMSRKLSLLLTLAILKLRKNTLIAFFSIGKSFQKYIASISQVVWN